MFLSSLLIVFLSFSCQPSQRNHWLFCSVSLAQAQQYTCPLASQQPVLTDQGVNQFCSQPGERGDCPFDSLCLSAANSPNLFICCDFVAAQVTPTCPNGGSPQPSAGGYKRCLISSPNDCDAGYSCVRAVNDASIQLCCSINPTQLPVCPNNGALLTERGRPVYCNVAQPQICPFGYTCQQAVGVSATFVCCASASRSTCPAQYFPSLNGQGNQIYCSPSRPTDCPGGSSCFQSRESASIFLCCRESTSPRVCPNNQNALLTPSGSVETCNSPRSICSKPGYTCQLSIPLAQYVCCGYEASRAFCADGRETYQQVDGQTFSCDPLVSPSTCPFGYECAPSTVFGVSVCCASNTIPATTKAVGPECPVGWSAYYNDIDKKPRTCRAVLDMSCPNGYSCTPSSTTGQFLCCRLATSLRCTRGKTFLANNHPRLCNRNRVNQCPRSYSCEQSTNPTVTICCSADLPDDRVLCPSGSSPALVNGFIRSCRKEGQSDGCPAGHKCERASNGLLVCCTSSVSRHSVQQTPTDVCPDNRQAMISSLSRDFIYCDDTAFMCPNENACLAMAKSDRYVCCSSIPKCIVGFHEVDDSGKIKKCTTSLDCSSEFECRSSDVDEIFICCSSEVNPESEFLSSPIRADVASINDEEWVVIEG